MRVGVAVTVMVECKNVRDGEQIASHVAGYVDGWLEKRLNVESWSSPQGHVFEEPGHTGHMIRYDKNPIGV